MKFRPFITILICAWSVLCLRPVAAAEQETKECWQYKLETKEYPSKEIGGDPITTSRTKGPFASRAECQADAQKNSGSKDYDLWYLDKRAWTPGPCESCSGSGSKNAEEKTRNPKSDLDQKLLDEAVSKRIQSWYSDMVRDAVDPLQADKLLQLSSLMTSNLWLKSALQNLGTAVGAYMVARGYIELVEYASESAIKRALELLEVPPTAQTDFTRASGAYLVTAPTQYSYQDDLSLARSAFLMSIGVEKIGTSKTEDVLGRVALIASAAVLSAEDGNKDFATRLLDESFTLLGTQSKSAKREKLVSLLSETNTSYRLAAKLPDWAQSGPQATQQSNELSLSGDWECFSSQPYNELCRASGTFTTSYGVTATLYPMTIIQSGKSLSIRSKSEMSAQGSLIQTVSTGSGELIGRDGRILFSSSTTYSNAAPQKVELECTIRILDNGDLELSSNYGGYSTVTVYRRR